MIQQTLEETKKLVWPEIKKYLKDPTYPKQFALSTKYKKEIDLYWKMRKVMEKLFKEQNRYMWEKSSYITHFINKI